MATLATTLPGPPEILPGRPDAVIDLQTDAGAALVGGTWRYRDAALREISFVDVGPDLGPSGAPNRTYDVEPHAQGRDYDDSDWIELAPIDTQLRLSTGRVCFNWYRIAVTVPERIGALDPTGATIVFEVVIDDYAEVWVDGNLPLALGQTGGQVVGGFNAPNRVVLTRDARPGQRFVIAIFGVNGPISASPANYIWMRTASLDVYLPERAPVSRPARLVVARKLGAIDAILPADPRLERVATGFEFTEGPVWSADGALLFSSPNTNVIYRWSPEGVVTIFRSKSGYAGLDIGRFHQPGSNGLTFDPQGRLVICQHGNRRVIRVEPHGNITVLADRFDGRRLNSPNDVIARSDGSVWFTDPPFGLPEVSADPAKELAFSGIFRAHEGEVTLISDELNGPNGLAFSPDERFLYVGNWDPNRIVIMRYPIDSDGAAGEGEVFFDMTGAPGDDAIDGIKIDSAGNLYVCGPNGIWVLSPAGRHLATLELPEAPHNLAWGDADAQTLYITAMTSIYRMRLRIPGIRP